ncbi:glycosyltransferase family 39 protein [Oscillospiraceae bacterium HV4-5-C5C]|nr:glycosyltransferase family 39 protein [Oscillospiraceae bacterium HV4-5-C5C]
MVFALEAAWGIYLGYGRGFLLGDASSRTANAFYVLFCKPYRLTSMGLVWNPLPSFLQLPFIALAKLWRPFATKGIGAAIMTAFFAGWSVKKLLTTFQAFQVSRFWSVTLTLLYAFNPYVFFYGANGMSEMLFICFGILVICDLTRWMKDGRARWLLSMGGGFVGMFLTRYEAIPFALSIGLAMAVQILFSKREKEFYIGQKKREIFYYLEATMWVTFLPIIYTLLVWILYNWSITGNPLYFMNSGYSMNAYSAYYSDYGGWAGAVSFVWVRSWPFLLLPAGILLVRTVVRELWSPDTLMLFLSVFGLYAFQFFMIAKGKSGGYVRYLCYTFMLATAWIPYLLGSLAPKRRRGAAAFLMAILCSCGLYFGWAFQYSSQMREDLLLSVPAQSEQLADYINSNLRGQTVLMDSYRTYYAIMNIEDQDSLVISCSLNFEAAVQDPQANQIDYVVVPQIGSYGNMDALNIQYPDLYNHGAAWCTEVATIGEFKIFKVLK